MAQGLCPDGSVLMGILAHNQSPYLIINLEYIVKVQMQTQFSSPLQGSVLVLLPARKKSLTFPTYTNSALHSLLYIFIVYRTPL